MLQSLLSALDDAVLAYNTEEDRFLFISPAVSDVFGYSREEFEADDHLLEKITIDEDRAILEKELADITKTGEDIFKYRIRTKTGEQKWIQEKRVNIVDEETGHKIRIQIARDITDIVFYKKDSEQRMWFMSSLINSMGAFVFRVDKEGRYTFVNDAYINRFHYTKEQLIGKPMDVVAHPDDVKLSYDELKKAIEDPSTVRHFRHRKVTAEGDIRYVITDAVAVRDKDNEITEVQGVGLDITEQERAKQELITSKKNIETVINNTTDQIWATDTNNRYVFANKAYKSWIKDVYYFEPEEGMLANDKTVYPKNISDSWDKYYKEVLNGQTVTFNYEAADPFTKDQVFFEISLNPIYGESDKIIGVSGFAHDVTDSIIKERAIMSQNERLKNIALISSHELRKPVASLMGLMDVLDKDNLANPENAEIFSHIEITAREVDVVVRQIVDNTFAA